MAFRLHFQDLSGNPLLTRDFADGEVTVGRSGECTVALNSTSVSRKHARFFVHLGRAYVEDLRSANGVVVNGARINGVHALVGPTVVVIGDHVVRFEPVNSPPPPEPVARPVASTPEPEWRPTLITLHGPEEHFPLIGAVSRLGRSSRADVQLLDGSISRIHSEIRIEADSVILVDLASANGTSLNGRPVAQPVALGEGDVIQLGDVPLLFTGVPDQVERDAVQVPTPSIPVANERLYMVAATLAVIVIVVAAAVIWASLSDSSSSSVDELHTARAAAAAAENRSDWQTAEASWAEALTLAPDDAEVLRSLDLARQHLAAQREFDACDRLLGTARGLQSGPPEPAIAAFVDAQTCFDAIRPESLMGQESRAALNTSVTPPLIELHRHAGALSRTAGDWDRSLNHLRTARRLQDARRDVDQETHTQILNGELRSVYIGAAEAAHASSDWGRAASLFTQANELAPLSEDQAQLLEEARRGTVQAP